MTRSLGSLPLLALGLFTLRVVRLFAPSGALRLGPLLLSTLLLGVTVAPSSALGHSEVELKQAPQLLLDAELMLGKDTPVEGWFSILGRVENVTDHAIKGELALLGKLPYGSERLLEVRAPLSLSARGRVQVELPMRAFSGVPELRLVAYGAAGEELASSEIRSPINPAPLLLDLEQPSRIAFAVRGRPLYVSGRPWQRSPEDVAVVVTSPEVVKGELMLPRYPAGYASVTLMLAQSKTLAQLSVDKQLALADWLLSGGALAVVISRPEDLRGGLLPKLIGGSVTPAPVQPELFQTTRFKIADPDPSRYSPSGSWMPATPTPGTAKELVSYAGGNLKPSPWGASASYGLGEVHLLAFDATGPPVDDPWVGLKVQALLRHAVLRGDALTSPYAVRPLDIGDTDVIRKHLDPNEGTGWTVVISALLLLIYAGLAGPVNFFSAAKVGKPLRAFKHLPLYALGASALILGIGLVGKGVSGRAQHLSLIETGAGMTRAPITRYRGFYASNTQDLTVHGSSREAVLDLMGRDLEMNRKLIVERDGARLDAIQGRPWQTTVVREDDFVGLGGGVSVIPTAEGATVVNRLGRDLVGVLVKLPNQPIRYFARIADGAKVSVVEGELADKRITEGGHTSVRDAITNPLHTAYFPKRLKSDAKGAAEAWRALDQLAEDCDWWPEDTPTGQLDGGEGRSSDSGLKLKRDEVLVRVLGWGGAL